MKSRKIICAVIALLISFSVSGFSIEPAAETEYDFSERIVYGGTAVDAGEYIYFSNHDDGMNLYRRLAGSNNSELIYACPAQYLNIMGERLYFISENKIISISLTGENEKVIYSSDVEISHLYAAPECLYFLCHNQVMKYANGKVQSVFAAEGMCAFLPLSENEFKWYVKNPDYTETDQMSEEFYHETQDKYLTYIHNTKTLKSKKAVINSYKAKQTEQKEYTGPYVKVGCTTLPLKEYMPGSFFSKNGKACTCHYDPNIDCIASINGCNCMRYWPTGIEETCEIDLLGAQCFAFARFIFYKCFGFIDHSFFSKGRYYNAGSIPPGAVTTGSAKELLTKAKTGAHVRLTRGHSVSILTMDEEHIVVYHCNAGGDGIETQPCIVSTRTFTWEEFASFSAAGISYVNMPYDYPEDVLEDSQKPSEGYYCLTDNLNIRSGTGTTYKRIAVLPAKSYVNVVQVSNGWGRIKYEGSVNRWICLDYASFCTKNIITPKENSSVYVDSTSGLLRGIPERCGYTQFSSIFPNQSITVCDRNGENISDSGYIGTGSIVKIEVGGSEVDSATAVVDGDANGNGIIDIGDYLIVKRIICDSSYLVDDIYMLAADVNCDEKINSKDYLIIKRYFIGVEETLANKS